MSAIREHWLWRQQKLSCDSTGMMEIWGTGRVRAAEMDEGKSETYSRRFCQWIMPQLEKSRCSRNSMLLRNMELNHQKLVKVLCVLNVAVSGEGIEKSGCWDHCFGWKLREPCFSEPCASGTRLQGQNCARKWSDRNPWLALYVLWLLVHTGPSSIYPLKNVGSPGWLSC